jgi:urease accessory protein
VFENDRLAMSFAAEPRACAHVTTAAATVVHRMPRGGHAEQSVAIDAQRDSLFEFVPEPLILFSGSRLCTRLTVRLEPGARIVVLDGILQHTLPDDSRPFDSLDTELCIKDTHGRRIARDRNFAQGSVWQAGAPGLAGPYSCQGTALVLGAGDAPLGPLRSALEIQPAVYGGATTLPEGIGVLARLLALDGVALRSALHTSHCVIRAALGLPRPDSRPK